MSVEIPERLMAEYVIFNAFESDNVEGVTPESVEESDIRDELTARNVTNVTFQDEQEIVVTGESTVREYVERIPASGGAVGEPPINPPEWVTREADLYFQFTFVMEDFGFFSGYYEVV